MKGERIDPRRAAWFWLRPKGSGTKPECGLESTLSQSTHLSQIGRPHDIRRPEEGLETDAPPIGDVHRRDWVAYRWRCLPCVRSEAGRRRERRDVGPPDRVAKGDVRRLNQNS